jgi:multiple sugar transport system substrate-binding protein
MDARPLVPERARRRLLPVLLALALVASSWAVARSSGLFAPAPVPVRVLMPAVFAEATAEPVRRFNRRHPGLRLVVDRGPLETEAISDLAVGSLLLGESPYDLLMMDITWTAKYAAAGWLEPLEGWLGADALAGMEPGALLGNRFGGHLWRMPFNGDTGLLYWRTDLMPAPPRTPAELVTISRSLQRRGKVRWGYVWQGRQYEGLSCVMLEVLHAFGGRWWDPERGTVLDEPAALEAAAWLEGLRESGVSPPAVANFAENEALQVFAAGEAAFLRNWPYAWREIERGGGPVVGKVGVTTMVGAGAGGGAGTLGSWGFSLLAGSPHPAEAAAVIRWLTGPELQRELVRREGFAPTWRELYEDPELRRRQPLLEVQRQALAAGPLVRPLTPLYAQLSDVLQRQLNGMLTGEAPAADAMARAQGRSQRIVRAAAGEAPPRR